MLPSLRSTVRSLLGGRLPDRENAVREHLRRTRPEPVLAAVIAVAAGIAVFVLATTIFEYHSSNHDEAVYLQQAAMLLEGQFEIHAGDLAGAFRPWFFVEDGGRLYPKYTPVPAAMYAITMGLVGEPRVTLAAVAAGNTALVYLLGSMVADRRVGVVASALFALSPLALLTTATFLPYAPTTLLNLAFAVAYLRGVRDGSLRSGALAGVAIGLAFFARPYTALLFALPFVAHACYAIWQSVSPAGIRPVPDPVRRNLLTAALGLVFVGVTLAYNARLTGAPFRFPYAAFAPLDGPGFGYRRILGHSLEYTPRVALRANGYVLRYFATRWFAGGLLGTLLAAAGVGIVARQWLGRRDADESRRWIGRRDADEPHRRIAGLTLAGLFVTVPLGNVAFWGNYNILATTTDPTDGLLSQFGPFYHFDLLAPLSVFAAVAVVAGWRRVRDGRVPLASALSPSGRRRLALAGLVLSVLVVAGASATLAAGPLDRNAASAEKYETAYEPIEGTAFEDAVVFLPTPYGDWQNHPFQYLRNDPGLDGPVVYALDREPAGDFAVIDAYPDRTYYRYTYRGEWTPNPDRHVTPKLEPLQPRTGTNVAGETTVGVPDRVERARVRLESRAGDHVEYAVADPAGELTVRWSMDADGATLDADRAPTESAGSPSVQVGDTDLVVLTVTLVQPDGSTLTYRQEATVRTAGGTVEVLWPPSKSVCPLVTDCGTEGTYLPDAGVHRDGVFFRTHLDVE